jgi:hypothetical protein
VTNADNPEFALWKRIHSERALVISNTQREPIQNSAIAFSKFTICISRIRSRLVPEFNVKFVPE